MLHAAGVGPYLPFGLISTLLGLEHDLAAGPVVGLLAAFAAVLTLTVQRWAVPRDLS